MDYKKLANLLFSKDIKDISYYESKYKPRDLKDGAKVTRFAPSPTGFIHFGGLFTSFVGNVVARQSGGIQILRIEDTDQKRKIDKGVDLIINGLKNFDIDFDEYPGKGDYGPYIQSQRKDIYQAYAKYLVEKGRAYPCFCSPEKLENDKKQQEANKELIGYYGPYAHCRNLSYKEIEQKVNNGEKFAIRLKVPEDFEKKIVYKDAIRGKMTIHNNHKDVVILKRDGGLPPYNFAHIIDDHLMRVNLAMRGDEFLPSLAEHIQIYKALDLKPIKYAHIAPIQKVENGKKRKLSKRKDPEAAVEYYYKKGYPSQSVMEYIMTIANSNFENWRQQNPHKDLSEFEFNLKKMNTSGALFDEIKLNDVSKNVISKFSANYVYEKTLKWASNHDKELYDLFIKYREYTIRMLNIEREKKKPRKDIGKWSDVKYLHSFFYDELFNPMYKKDYDFEYEKINYDDLKYIFDEYLKRYDKQDD
ncbi:MAG: glutamate--tRNA ligase, partial [bacterium]